MSIKHIAVSYLECIIYRDFNLVIQVQTNVESNESRRLLFKTFQTYLFPEDKNANLCNCGKCGL